LNWNNEDDRSRDPVEAGGGPPPVQLGNSQKLIAQTQKLKKKPSTVNTSGNNERIMVSEAGGPYGDAKNQELIKKYVVDNIFRNDGAKLKNQVRPSSTVKGKYSRGRSVK
jgi:hypothetical protein